MSQSGKWSAWKGVSWEAVCPTCFVGRWHSRTCRVGLPPGEAVGKIQWSSASLAEKGWKNWDKHWQRRYPTTTLSLPGGYYILPGKCHTGDTGNVRPKFSKWETALQDKTSPPRADKFLSPEISHLSLELFSMHHLYKPTWPAGNTSFPQLRPGRDFIKISHNTKSHIQRESYVHSKVWTVQWWGRGHWI